MGYENNLRHAELTRVTARSVESKTPVIGSTGSRLLAGSNWYHAEVEEWLAGFFDRCAVRRSRVWVSTWMEGYHALLVYAGEVR